MAHPLWHATVRTEEGKEIRFTLSAMSLKHAWTKAGHRGDQLAGGKVEVIHVEAK